MSEQELNQMLSYRVPDEMVIRLIRLSKRTGKSVSELCRDFTAEGIERAKKKRGSEQESLTK